MKKPKSEYRNAVRSRMLIRNAFLELMKTQDIFKIKAKDVIELANISKGTFYAHYTGTFAVYQEIENEYLDLMFKIFQDSTEPVTFEHLLPLFLSGLEEIEKDRDVFLLLFQTSYGDPFVSKIKHRFVEYMLASYAQTCGIKNEARARGFFVFVAGGALTLIVDWMRDPNPISSTACAKFINECIQQGVKCLD